jgi:hypothetical protein
MPNIREKIRKWIDGDQSETLLEDLRTDTKSQNQAARVVLGIANEVFRALADNFIPSKDNIDAYFPALYEVFLGEADYRLCTGDRLDHIKGRVSQEVLRQVREHRIDLRNRPESIKMKFRLDGTLGLGQVRVKALGNHDLVNRTEENPSSSAETLIDVLEEPKTEEDTNRPARLLYSLFISVKNSPDEAVFVEKHEISIGRGKGADIRLKTGDSRVGRIHCVLRFWNGELYLTSTNKNPTWIGEYAVSEGETIKVSTDAVIQIYDSKIRVNLSTT